MAFSGFLISLLLLACELINFSSHRPANRNTTHRHALFCKLPIINLDSAQQAHLLVQLIHLHSGLAADVADVALVGRLQLGLPAEHFHQLELPAVVALEGC